MEINLTEFQKKKINKASEGVNKQIETSAVKLKLNHHINWSLDQIDEKKKLSR